AYLSSHTLEIKDELLKFANRNTEWKYDDLASSLPQVLHGRSFEVGRSLFKVANCVACHKLNNEGKEIGPDLTKLDPKKQNLEYLLRSLIEPSKEIEEKYQSNTFVLASGKVVTGMIVKETDDEIQLLVDPMAKADPITISVDDIDDQVKSKLSIMPAGLLNKLTEEEILDLLAYIYAQGDMKHKMYSEHMHHP
ncbi:MAG TPA: dehydrogenase, partial [Planctomycetaceae bacterium]|nr:dehydrogenase [Planctomycetaceae bacterium]